MIFSAWPAGNDRDKRPKSWSWSSRTRMSQFDSWTRGGAASRAEKWNSSCQSWPRRWASKNKEVWCRNRYMEYKVWSRYCTVVPQTRSRCQGRNQAPRNLRCCLLKNEGQFGRSTMMMAEIRLCGDLFNGIVLIKDGRSYS
jgi:hypothetical protein